MKQQTLIDMTEGPLFGKILGFAIPLMLSNYLQLLFNVADNIVVGRFAGSASLAAVGATTVFVNLLVNLFSGVAAGANVVVARHLGEKDETRTSRAVHTAVALGLVTGILLIFAGFFLSYPVLALLDTPADVLDSAVLYMRVYFTGMPFLMLYNFSAAVLRAMGDTKKPLLFLGIAGILNLALNLIFVIVFHWDVFGVAFATALSQVLSAILTLRYLSRLEGACRFNLHGLRFWRAELIAMIRIGLPAGVHSYLYSMSNMVIQRAVNSFGSTLIAANTIAANLDNFLSQSTSAFFQTAMTFSSQNVGAQKPERVLKTLKYSILCAVFIDFVLGRILAQFGTVFLSFYTSDQAVIQYGLIRLSIVAGMYFIAGVMDPIVAALRGMGQSVAPMVVSIFSIVGLRILYIHTVFATFHTMKILYLTYPATWAISTGLNLLLFFYFYRKLKRECASSEPQTAAGECGSKQI